MSKSSDILLLVASLGSVVLVLGLPSFAAAQRTTGTLVGHITDQTGAVLPGVTVALTSDALMASQISRSNEQGLYRFVALPPGSYILTFTLPRFLTLRREAVRISVGSTTEENVSLLLSPTHEELTVRADNPVVDTQSNQVSAHYDRTWVENAPINRFSFFDLVNAAPGVNASTSTSGQSTVLGASTNDSSYQLDGTDFTAPSTGNSWPLPNTDAIEEIEVLTLGAPAEYGNVQGAVFNVVTRQGGNAFHGDLNAYFQHQELTGRNTTDEEDGGMPFHRARYNDVTAQLGGPLIHDRLWFFGAYQYQRDEKSPAGTPPEFPSRFSTHRVFFKLNFQISPRNRIMLAYHDDYARAPGEATALTAPSTILLFHGHNPSPNLTFTSLLTDRTFIEARVSGFYGDSHLDPLLAGEPRVKPRFLDLSNGHVTGGTPLWSDGTLWKTAASAKLSHFADDFLAGSHDFRFGIQYASGGSDDIVGYNDFVYTADGQPLYGVTQIPFHQGGRMTTWGVFVDDAFRVDRRLTLNLGLRYDHSRAGFDAFPALDRLGNETGRTSPRINEVFSWNVVSPRLGLNWRITADGKTVLKSHYGRYYRAIVTSEFESAGRSIAPQYFFAGTYDAAGNPEGLELAFDNSNLRVDPGFKAPYADQIVLGLERRLLPNLGIAAHYVHKRGRQYGGWRDVGGVYASANYSDTLGTDASGEDIEISRLVSSAESRVFLLTSPAEMSTWFDGVVLQLTKPMAGRWQLNSSLVLSRSRGRLGSSLNGTRAEQQSIAQRFGQNPNDLVNTDGLLVEDRPVVFKTQLVYELPAGFLVSANFVHQTGRPWGRLVRLPEDLAGIQGIVVLAERISGKRRVSDSNVLDLRLQKEWSLRRRVRLALFTDVLNVTNDDAFEGVGSRLGTSSSFGQPVSFILPRRLMAGAKLRF